MSKRSRALYEAELQAQQSPYVAVGTPLPPLDDNVRDDGSYVPVWKQEVRDEKGRRRLHGAFTGGWSAGYFNTVGSKEGWTPSTFVSSRTNRRKDDPDAVQNRPEDYMDEEDLADEESKKFPAADASTALGLTENDSAHAALGGLSGLFRVDDDTLGKDLLKKMGWKEGQGIGPKVRRAARLGVGRPEDGQQTHWFAPENVAVTRLVRKNDCKGLGYQGAARLSLSSRPSRTANPRVVRHDDDDDDEDNEEDNDDVLHETSGFRSALLGRSKAAGHKAEKKRGGMGMGVLNDTGSDDEDPYDMGPRISLNRTIGGDKKKKKKSEKPEKKEKTEKTDMPAADDLGRSKFVFSKRPSVLSRISGNRLCHDGRPPLAGFHLAREPDALTSDISGATKFPPPLIPPGWISSKQPRTTTTTTTTATDKSYVSTADAARASQLDPKARAALLGESQLPGKSVFDFLSPAARDRIAAATGRTDLPQARSEVPREYALTEAEKLQQLLREVPALDKATAIAAISRGARGGGPYQEDEAKRSRYRAYLEYHAGIASALPARPAALTNDDWLREFHEFFNCARIFKPMSGLMASRFTTSTSTSTPTPAKKSGQESLVTRPAPKPQDPAEEAAQLGMFGPLTRSVQEFLPTRLLCKRMGVKPPAHVLPDDGGQGSRSTSSAPYAAWSAPAARYTTYEPQEASGKSDGNGVPEKAAAAKVVVEADRNEAIEGERASDDVFRAVFGDSDEEEED